MCLLHEVPSMRAWRAVSIEQVCDRCLSGGVQMQFRLLDDIEERTRTVPLSPKLMDNNREHLLEALSALGKVGRQFATATKRRLKLSLSRFSDSRQPSIFVAYQDPTSSARAPTRRSSWGAPEPERPKPANCSFDRLIPRLSVSVPMDHLIKYPSRCLPPLVPFRLRGRRPRKPSALCLSAGGSAIEIVSGAPIWYDQMRGGSSAASAPRL